MNDQLVSVKTERSNGSLLVHLSGEIDLSNSHQLHQQLESVLEGWPRVILDLAEIEYLDSEGLHLIKQLCDKGDRDGTEFQFVAPPDSFARQVLEMTRMSAYIEIRDSLEG
jgi:anti-sigma B factor antagonist